MGQSEVNRIDSMVLAFQNTHAQHLQTLQRTLANCSGMRIMLFILSSFQDIMSCSSHVFCFNYISIFTYMSVFVGYLIELSASLASVNGLTDTRFFIALNQVEYLCHLFYMYLFT